MATEKIATGKKCRIMVDSVNRIWERISYWTKASDVECDDGNDIETKVGAIQGITSDVNGESDDIAASISIVNDINYNLNSLISRLGGFYPEIDSKGQITSYRTDKSRGVLFPFTGGFEASVTVMLSTGNFMLSTISHKSNTVQFAGKDYASFEGNPLEAYDDLLLVKYIRNDDNFSVYFKVDCFVINDFSSEEISVKAGTTWIIDNLTFSGTFSIIIVRPDIGVVITADDTEDPVGEIPT